MARKNLLEKLTPSHFANGDSFDKEVFCSLIVALQKQRTYLWVAPVILITLMLISQIFAFGIGGAIGNFLGVACLFSAVILAGIPIRKSSKPIKSACEKLNITTKDISAAIRKVKEEEWQQLIDLSASPFAEKDGFEKSVFVSLVAAIQKQRHELWKVPLCWAIVVIITGMVTAITVTSIKIELAYEYTEGRIILIMCVLIGILASYLLSQRVAKQIATACAKLGITPDEAKRVVRQAKEVGKSPKKNRIKVVWLILAILSYVLVFCGLASEASGDVEGFLALGLSLVGILGAVLTYKKKQVGHWLTLLLIVIPFGGCLVSDSMMGNELWIMAGGLFGIPYIVFVRYFLYKNNMDKPFGKYVVYGTCILLLAVLAIQLSGKTYLKINDYSCGMASVLSKEGKWGYRDAETHKEVIPCIYDEAQDFEHPISGYWYEQPNKSRAKVRLNGKWGAVNKYGEEKIPCIYDALGKIDSITTARMNGKWGFIDMDNHEVIPFVYDSIRSSFQNYEVQMNGKWGIIDKSGQEVVPCEYDTNVNLQAKASDQTVTTDTKSITKTMKIANIDRSANRFDFVDTDTGNKLTYLRLIVNGVEPAGISCIVKEGTEMVQFILKEKKALSTRQEGGQTIITYSGESTTSYSIYSVLKYKLEDGVLTILGLQ